MNEHSVYVKEEGLQIGESTFSNVNIMNVQICAVVYCKSVATNLSDPSNLNTLV